MIQLKYNHTDIGYCRVCFTIDVEDQTLYYCIQEEGPGVEFYRCSKDWEPDSPVSFKVGSEFILDIPKDLNEYATGLISCWKKQYNYKETLKIHGATYLKRVEKSDEMLKV